MKAIIIILLAAFMATGGAASAQDRETELARQILERTGEVDSAFAMIEDMMPLIEGNIRAAYPDLASRQYLAIVEVYREEFAASRGEFEALFTQVYVDEFSEDELEQLLEFYHSDIGRRLTEALPRIQSVAGEAAEQIGIRVDRRAMPRVRDIILGRDGEQ